MTYGSYINRNSNETTGCTPTGFNPATGINTYTGVKNGTCNHDIVLSASTNAGASFAGGSSDVRQLPVITNAPGQARTDQFWQGAEFSPDGTSRSATTTASTAPTRPPASPTSRCRPGSPTPGRRRAACRRRPSSAAPSTVTTPGSPSPPAPPTRCGRTPARRTCSSARHRHARHPAAHLPGRRTERVDRQRPGHLHHPRRHPLTTPRVGHPRPRRWPTRRSGDLDFELPLALGWSVRVAGERGGRRGDRDVAAAQSGAGRGRRTVGERARDAAQERLVGAGGARPSLG